MERPSSEQTTIDGDGRSHSLGTWTRIYVHGCIVFLVVSAVAYLVTRLVPIFESVGSPGLAVTLSILAILVAPPVAGSILLFGILPLLGKKEAWRGLTMWDDRLLSELSLAKQRTQIVILNWPSKEVRTMGVLTTRFPSDGSTRQMAAVYVPTAPPAKFGYIHIIPVEDLEFTDWTLKQWQLYQFTFGSVHPESLL